MRIPEITTLQFVALKILMDGECSGRRLREGFAAHGHRKSAPAFYQFMARIEEAGFVKGRYDQKIVEGQIIKERVYELTGSGRAAHDEFCELVNRRFLPGLRGV